MGIDVACPDVVESVSDALREVDADGGEKSIALCALHADAIDVEALCGEGVGPFHLFARSEIAEIPCRCLAVGTEDFHLKHLVDFVAADIPGRHFKGEACQSGRIGGSGKVGDGVGDECRAEVLDQHIVDAHMVARGADVVEAHIAVAGTYGDVGVVHLGLLHGRLVSVVIDAPCEGLHFGVCPYHHLQMVVPALVAVSLEVQAVHAVGVEIEGRCDEPVVGIGAADAVVEGGIIFFVKAPHVTFEGIDAIVVGVDDKEPVEAVVRVETFDEGQRTGSSHILAVRPAAFAFRTVDAGIDIVDGGLHLAVGEGLCERCFFQCFGHGDAFRLAHHTVGEPFGVEVSAAGAEFRRLPDEGGGGAFPVGGECEGGDRRWRVHTEVGYGRGGQRMQVTLGEADTYGMVADTLDGGVQADGLTGCGGTVFEFLSVESYADFHVAGKCLLGIGACGHRETDFRLHGTVFSGHEAKVLDVVRGIGMGVGHHKSGNLFHIVEVPCRSRDFGIVKVHAQELCEGVVIPFVDAEVVGVAGPEVSSGAEVDGCTLVFVGRAELCLCHKGECTVLVDAVELTVGSDAPQLSAGIGGKVAQTFLQCSHLAEFTAFGVHLAEVTAVAVSEGQFADGIELVGTVVVGKVNGYILVVLLHGDASCRHPRLRIDFVECHLIAAIGACYIVADVASLAVGPAGIGYGLAVGINLRDGHKGMRTVGIERVEAVFRVAVVPREGIRHAAYELHRLQGGRHLQRTGNETCGKYGNAVEIVHKRYVWKNVGNLPSFLLLGIVQTSLASALASRNVFGKRNLFHH